MTRLEKDHKMTKKVQLFTHKKRTKRNKTTRWPIRAHGLAHLKKLALNIKWSRIKLWALPFKLLGHKNEWRGARQQDIRLRSKKKKMQKQSKPYEFCSLEEGINFKLWASNFLTPTLPLQFPTHKKWQRGTRECTITTTTRMITPSQKQGKMKGAWPWWGIKTFYSLEDDIAKEDGNSQGDGAKHKQNMELHKQVVPPNF